MRTNCLLLLVISILMGRVASAQDVAVEAAQTAEGATLRGAGAYLKGLGWYNLNTAQANAINADTAIKWQRDLRKLAQDDRDLRARFAAGKTARFEDVKRRLRAREQQLRTNPSGNDVVSGEALNVLFFDLTDPDFTTDRWLKSPVKLPNGMSVKDLTFQFMSASNSSDSSKLLSKGVIALSRLDIEGKWTTALSVDALASERTSYEKAYAKVRDQVLAGKLTVDALLAMDRTLDALKSKVQTAVPMERGFRTEATRSVEDLKIATRMFDASTVEYAKEMLLDTQEHDAKTVLELVRFMLKYRLQFATTERSPAGRELYGELYELMKQQLTGLGGGGANKPDELLTFSGHTGAVWSMAFSPDGKLVASGQGAHFAGGEGSKPKDFKLLLWDVETGKIIHRLSGHDATIRTVAFSPDGQRIASGSWDKTIRLWDVKSGKMLRTFTGHTEPITGGITFTPEGNRIISGSVDKTARAWDVNTGNEIRAIPATGEIHCIALSSDGRRLATGENGIDNKVGNSLISLWELESGNLLRRFDGAHSINSLCFSSDDDHLLSAGIGWAMQLWDVESGVEIKSLDGHAAAFTPDGKHAFSDHKDGVLVFWDLATGTELQRLGKHSEVICVAVSRDGKRALSGGGDKKIKVWALLQ